MKQILNKCSPVQRAFIVYVHMRVYIYTYNYRTHMRTHAPAFPNVLDAMRYRLDVKRILGGGTYGAAVLVSQRAVRGNHAGGPDCASDLHGATWDSGQIGPGGGTWLGLGGELVGSWSPVEPSRA